MNPLRFSGFWRVFLFTCNSNSEKYANYFKFNRKFEIAFKNEFVEEINVVLGNDLRTLYFEVLLPFPIDVLPHFMMATHLSFKIL